MEPDATPVLASRERMLTAGWTWDELWEMWSSLKHPPHPFDDHTARRIQALHDEWEAR